MRRAVIAFAVLAGSVVPILVASVWLFGCCVLPFHHVLHRLLPLCRISVAYANSRPSQPATAPPEKQSPTLRMTAVPAAGIVQPWSPRFSRLIAASPAGYRSFIALGAMRCDRDVGLHAFLSTFLI